MLRAEEEKEDEAETRGVTAVGVSDKDRRIDAGSFAEERRKALRVGLFEFVRLIANRVYFSKAYAVLYAFMVVLNVIMLLWLIANGGNGLSESFILLEIVVTAMLGLEVLTRMLSQGKSYFSRFSNWFELLVLLLCTASIYATSSAQTLSVSEEMDELLSWAMLITRYVMQGLRLVAVLRHRKRMKALGLADGDYVRARRTSSAGIIDFDTIREEDLGLDPDDLLSLRDSFSDASEDLTDSSRLWRHSAVRALDSPARQPLSTKASYVSVELMRSSDDSDSI